MLSHPANTSEAPRTTGPFQAVVFDCDGVLVDSEVLVIEALTGVCSGIGLDYDAAVHCTRFLGLEAAAIFEQLENDYRRQYAKPLPASFRQDCLDRYRAAAEQRLNEVPGARAAIEALHLPIAVASSSDLRSLNWKLDKTHLRDLFGDHVYSRDSVAHSKPAPDLYLHAARELDVAPEDCLVIEDSPNGIAAARAAGMTAWGFAGGGHLRNLPEHRLFKCGCAQVVKDWRSVAAMLADA
jgi:HAD superfamily hydrolase (TIGR01509 family)